MKSRLAAFISRYLKQIPGIKSYVFAACMVFLFGLIISIVAWRLDQQRIITQRDAALKEQVASFENDISSRLTTYEQMLRGFRGFFAASPNIDQEAWLRYVTQYDYQSSYTGISGVGYMAYVTDNKLPSYLAIMRKSTPAFSISPAGDREVYVPLTFSSAVSNDGTITPSRNLGFDVMTDPTRRQMIEKARDTGQTNISEKITLLGDRGTANQSSFIMYVANYGENRPQTVQERQATIEGFVFAGYRSSEFFAEVMDFAKPRDYQAIQVFDGTNTNMENILYESANFQDFSENSRTQPFTIPVFDRSWTVRLAGGPTITQVDSQRPILILTGGTLLSLAIATVLFLVMLTRARAIVYAKRDEAQQAKDDLLSLASHQLRTPATAVKQYLGMMLEGYTGKVSKRQLPSLQKAYVSNERQLETINQILYVAKADAGRLSIHPHYFDLNLLVDEIADDVTDSLEAKQQNLRIERSRKQIKLFADEACIRMVVENLISNASKYSHANTTVTVKTGSDARRAWVQVRDQGVGIDRADFDKLFKKFSRIDNDLALHVDGSGIGLYIDKVLIELHGGTIEVSSELGKGSVFTIHLPLKSGMRKIDKNLTDGDRTNA